MTFPTLPLDLQHPDLEAAWATFVEHRAQLDRPKLTRRAIEMKMKKFRLWGAWYAALLLRIAVERGWTDVYEPDRPTRYTDGRFIYFWRGDPLEFGYVPA